VLRRFLPIVLLVIAGGAAVVIVLSSGRSAVSPPPTTGPVTLQAGPPPWRADQSGLAARLAAAGLAALRAEGQVQHTHEHVDILIDGAAVSVPADIGINRSAGFISPIHTHDATGIIHVESPVVRDFTLGEFFDVWGVRFDGRCIGGECAGGSRTMSVFVNGQPVTSDPRSVVLTEHEEIVVAVGTAAQLPNPIPAAFGFPPGL
jgi:hypothetical protein